MQSALDELKNQWGLGRFTTKGIHRCQAVARDCALVYNRRSLYCRAAYHEGLNGGHHLSRGTESVCHANQTTLYPTPRHGLSDILKKMIAKIGKSLQHAKNAAQQFKRYDL